MSRAALSGRDGWATAKRHEIIIAAFIFVIVFLEVLDGEVLIHESPLTPVLTVSPGVALKLLLYQFEIPEGVIVFFFILERHFGDVQQR